MHAQYGKSIRVITTKTFDYYFDEKEKEKFKFAKIYPTYFPAPDTDIKSQPAKAEPTPTTVEISTTTQKKPDNSTDLAAL